MIALNELIKNRELFERRYLLKGKKVSLNKIFLLEQKRKKLQLETESMRATCNKFCGQIAEKRSSSEDISTLISEIEDIDKNITKNSKILLGQTLKLDKMLQKLHNLPDDENQSNLQLETLGKSSSLQNLETFLNKIAQILPYDESINKLLKKKQNYLFSELPTIAKCSDGFMILLKKDQFEEIKTKILDYFKNNAQHIIKFSIKKLPKHCTDAYLVHLDKALSLDIEIVKEFESRKYKIKYRDVQADMTKFVCQINIRLR